MKRLTLKAPLAAALGLLVMTAAAPIALADPPAYYFQDSDVQPSLNAGRAPAHVVADSPAATGNQQDALAIARQAEQLAQRALHQAQQAVQEAQQR
jgi:hypothetical protein